MPEITRRLALTNKRALETKREASTCSRRPWPPNGGGGYGIQSNAVAATAILTAMSQKIWGELSKRGEEPGLPPSALANQLK